MIMKTMWNSLKCLTTAWKIGRCGQIEVNKLIKFNHRSPTSELWLYMECPGKLFVVHTSYRKFSLKIKCLLNQLSIFVMSRKLYFYAVRRHFCSHSIAIQISPYSTKLYNLMIYMNTCLVYTYRISQTTQIIYSITNQRWFKEKIMNNLTKVAANKECGEICIKPFQIAI